MPLLHDAGSYEAVRDAFEWNVPERVNMAWQVCDRHAEASPEKTGLIVAGTDGRRREYSWLELQRLSNRMANFMTAEGVHRGDRVGILLTQSVEAAISHVASWKMGAISIPLFSLFGEEALAFRLKDSGARVIVTEAQHYHNGFTDIIDWEHFECRWVVNVNPSITLRFKLTVMRLDALRALASSRIVTN